MATRATYGFYARSEFRPNTTIYIHWDGYEEGASHYYLNALAWAFENHGRLSFSMEDFIRANDSAELTLDHDTHSDTEYRYDILTQELCEAPNWQSCTNDYTLDDLINVSRRTDFYGNEWSVSSYTIRELIAKYHADKLQLLERALEEKHPQ